MIDKLREVAGMLSAWECDFIDSLELGLKRGLAPTQASYDVLVGIYKRECE